MRARSSSLVCACVHFTTLTVTNLTEHNLGTALDQHITIELADRARGFRFRVGGCRRPLARDTMAQQGARHLNRLGGEITCSGVDKELLHEQGVSPAFPAWANSFLFPVVASTVHVVAHRFNECIPHASRSARSVLRLC